MHLASAEPAVSDDLVWCHDAVRRGDRDRFLCGVFAPPAARAGVWALYALNLELAHIREAVTDPLPGQIRLQWWREAMHEAYTTTPRAHPVVRLVAATLPGKVAESGLQALIDARAADLESGGPETLPALEDYLAATAGRLQMLVAESLTGGQLSPQTQTAVKATGMAWGLVGMIRAVAFQAHSSQLILPRREMKASGVREGDLMNHTMTAQLGEMVARMAARADAQLAIARAVSAAVERAALPALLPCVLAEGYLRQLRRAGWNPFVRGLDRPGVRTLMRLWWRARRGRYTHCR
jgi:phytoene synthase